MSDLALHEAIGWVSDAMGPAALHAEARRASRAGCPGIARVLRAWATSAERARDEVTDREDRSRDRADIQVRRLLYGDRWAS